MTANGTDAMLVECLDEVEHVLLSYRHHRLRPAGAWGSTATRALQVNHRTVTMTLTVDVTAPTQPDD